MIIIIITPVWCSFQPRLSLNTYNIYTCTSMYNQFSIQIAQTWKHVHTHLYNLTTGCKIKALLHPTCPHLQYKLVKVFLERYAFMLILREFSVLQVWLMVWVNSRGLVWMREWLLAIVSWRNARDRKQGCIMCREWSGWNIWVDELRQQRVAILYSVLAFTGSQWRIRDW